MIRLTAPALALVLAWGASAATSAETNEPPVLTVATVAPQERQWPETVPAGGWLKPWHEAVVAAEIDGLRITDVLVDVGAVVTKGQPLVRLADDSVRAELRKEEASLATARADLARAKANADRARLVQKSGALSGEKITDYLIAEQTAAAGLAAAAAALESQMIRLARTTVAAPDDGLVIARSAQLGAVVSAGDELFRLTRQRRIEWQAEVSARFLPRIRDGQTATLTDPGDLRIDGTVRLVGPTVSPDTGRAIVFIALSAGANPPAGLYVTGDITLGTTAALTVPDSALVLRDGFSYVYTVGAEERVSRRRVETGRRRDGRVEIVSGLDRTAAVVASGGAFLADNALVRLAGGGQ